MALPNEMHERARDIAAYLGHLGRELPYIALIALWSLMLSMAVLSYFYYFSTSPVVVSDEGINSKRAALAKIQLTPNHPPRPSPPPPPIDDAISPLTLESADVQRASELTAESRESQPVEQQRVEAAASAPPASIPATLSESRTLNAVTKKTNMGRAIPESEWGSPAIQGYLMKKSTRPSRMHELTSRWQRRWCVASGHFLRYYRIEAKTGDADLRAMIDLNLVDVERSSGRYFFLLAEDVKVSFRATTEASAEEWFQKLRELQRNYRAASGAGTAPLGRKPATRKKEKVQ